MSVPVEETILTNTQNEPSETDEKDSLDGARIVFFDGVCGMCNYFVDFVITKDKEKNFLFAPLQGETAQKLLPASDTKNLKSIVLIQQGKMYRHSSAVVRVLWGLPAFWKFLGSVLWVIPRPIRNWGYRLTAKVRYRIFGKKEACRLPTPEERSRFLA